MIDELLMALRNSSSAEDWRLADEIEVTFSSQGWREMAVSMVRKTREAERATIDAVNEECKKIVDFLYDFDPILAYTIETKEYLK